MLDGFLENPARQGIASLGYSQAEGSGKGEGGWQENSPEASLGRVQTPKTLFRNRDFGREFLAIPEVLTLKFVDRIRGDDEPGRVITAFFK